jgi:hypothetical protein
MPVHHNVRRLRPEPRPELLDRGMRAAQARHPAGDLVVPADHHPALPAHQHAHCRPGHLVLEPNTSLDSKRFFGCHFIQISKQIKMLMQETTATLHMLDVSSH